MNESEDFRQGSIVVESLAITAPDISMRYYSEDVFGSHTFPGTVRDIDFVRSTGYLNYVTLYSSLAVKIAADELKGNPNASAVIGSTGDLVAPIWTFIASEMGKRALESKRNEEETHIFGW